MKVFVTGGTGTIGTAVVRELLDHQHTVVALARSELSARTLEHGGAEVLDGDLADLEALREGAERCDGVVHLAFAHDEDLDRAMDEEEAALAALGQTLVGSDRPLVMTSGTPWVTGRAATEDDPQATDGPVGQRARSVNAGLALAASGVRSAVVRIPRTAHDQGHGGFAGLLTDQARRSRVAGYPGEGTQRWPAVHARDAATLYRLVLEKAPAGTTWHAVADEGNTVLDIVHVIGRRLDLPVQPVPDSAFGPYGPIFALDQPATSNHTRQALGWNPTGPGLLADLELLIR